jgi:uncharacterized protein involved in exopolysaccharide biosynthesis
MRTTMKKEPATTETDLLEAAELDAGWEPTPAERQAARESRIAALRRLWDARRRLVRITLAGTLAALLLAFVLPTRYEATAQLMPPDAQPNFSSALLAAAGAPGIGAMASSLLGLRSSSALFVGVLGSRTVQDRLITEFGLMELYGARRIEDAREKLASRTSLSEDRKSGIITIRVTDADPERAAAMAGAYVRELDRLVVEVSTSAAQRERLFLQERLRAVKEELDAAAREFSEFASRNTTIDIKEQGRAMVEAAAELHGRLITAETELEGLRQIYTDNNVRVRAVRARIAELRQQIARLGGQSGDEPAAASGSPYPSIRDLPRLGVTYADLYRRTRIHETVFELLTQQYELAKVQEAKETPNVKLLDAPVVPQKKSFPPRLLILLAGTIFAFAAGVGWVLGTAKWEQTDPADPGRRLAEEVLTSLRNEGARLGGLAGNGLGGRRRSANGKNPQEQAPSVATPLTPENSRDAEERQP